MKIFLLVFGWAWMVIAALSIVSGDWHACVAGLFLAGIYLSGGAAVSAVDRLGDRLKRILLDGRPY